MSTDLFENVSKRLASCKGQWKEIAHALAPDVSYSMIAKIGRGAYPSEPSYRKLQLIADHLDNDQVTA